MNVTATRLLQEHDGNAITVLPGEGFENLTAETACTYLLDSDNRILSLVLETSMDEPLDDTCDFFRQQMFLASEPSPAMREWGIGRIYGKLVIVRLALDGVPDWQRHVIKQRIYGASNEDS